MGSRESAFESEMIFFARRHRIKLRDFDAEQIGAVGRKTVIRSHRVFIDQPGIAGSDERSAVLNVEFEAIGFTAGKKVERWSDDEFIA